MKKYTSIILVNKDIKEIPEVTAKVIECPPSKIKKIRNYFSNSDQCFISLNFKNYPNLTIINSRLPLDNILQKDILKNYKGSRNSLIFLTSTHQFGTIKSFMSNLTETSKVYIRENDINIEPVGTAFSLNNEIIDLQLRNDQSSIIVS